MIEIESRDYWFKIVEFLQQNWALIAVNPDETATVHFFDDASSVFDVMHFETVEVAERGLRRNGFNRFADDKKAQEFIGPPDPPFFNQPMWRKPIYSSGAFWKE